MSYKAELIFNIAHCQQVGWLVGWLNILGLYPCNVNAINTRAFLLSYNRANRWHLFHGARSCQHDLGRSQRWEGESYLAQLSPTLTFL